MLDASTDDASKFIPLRTKQAQTMKKLVPIVNQTSHGDKTLHLDERPSSNNGNNQFSLNREYEISKLQTQLLSCKDKNQVYSRVAPMFGTRDSAEYSNSSSSLGSGMHSSRAPAHHLKPGMNNKYPDYQREYCGSGCGGARENSQGRLPQIETGYNRDTRFDISVHTSMPNTNFNRRSKSWKRPEH